jgi:hypothetical protein
MTRLALLVWGTATVWAIGYLISTCVRAYRRGRAEIQVLERNDPRISYANVEARRKLAQAKLDRAAADEVVLLGPVSVWVAEGEARAIREWERKRLDPNIEPPADISDIRMTTIRS